VPELDRGTARDWIDRWDRQQEESLPDREDRFTALIDAVEEGTERPDPLVLDLGCGPGSLAVRLLDRLPRATVIGIDADPVSLTLGQAAYSGRPGLRARSTCSRSRRSVRRSARSRGNRAGSAGKSSAT
jgi:SAM-dependent methyltransferase